MKKTSTNIVITAIIALCCGYFLGIIIDIPSSDNLSGDVKRAVRHKTEVSSDVSNLLIEKIQNDAQYREELTYALAVMNNSAKELGSSIDAVARELGNSEGAQSFLSAKEYCTIAAHSSEEALKAVSEILTIDAKSNVDIESALNSAFTSATLYSQAVDMTISNAMQVYTNTEAMNAVGDLSSSLFCSSVLMGNSSVAQSILKIAAELGIEIKSSGMAGTLAMSAMKGDKSQFEEVKSAFIVSSVAQIGGIENLVSKDALQSNSSEFWSKFESEAINATDVLNSVAGREQQLGQSSFADVLGQTAILIIGSAANVSM